MESPDSGCVSQKTYEANCSILLRTMEGFVTKNGRGTCVVSRQFVFHGGNIMNKKTIIAAAAFLVLVALVLGVWLLTRPQEQIGAKTITVTIAHSDGTDQSYTWTTTATTLAEAMNEKGLLGEDVDGMYLTVDGETTDFAANQSWWCLYKNEETTVEGANTMLIADGDHFRWEYTIGF